MPYKGNLFLTTSDLSTSGRGIDAEVTRSYNSRQITGPGGFGSGWVSNLDMRVWDLSGSVAFLDAAGTRHIFDRLANDTYSPPPGITLSLTRDDTNSVFKITTIENTVLHFDMNTGKLTKIVDSNTQTTTYTKETATGDLLITDPSGRVSTRIHYRADGKVDYATDPKGRKAQYAYNASGLLQSVTMTYGAETATYAYTYVPNTSLLSTATDPQGNIVTYSYDIYNRISSVTRTLNGTSITNTYSYNTTVIPRQVTVTGMNGEQTIYHTNDNGNVEKTEVKLNATETATTTYKWDAYNHLYEINRPNTQTTKVDYGDNGKPIQVTTPDSKDVRVNYDTNNNMISAKDPLHNVEGSLYNSNNNSTDVSDATGNTIMMEYADNGNLISITDAMSLAENYVYNSGFERSSSNQPIGWNASRTLGTGDIYETSGTAKSGGYQSFHIKSGASGSLYGVMIYQMPVTPKMTYSLSGDIKLGANSTAEMKVSWYNSSGTKLSEETGLSLSKAGLWGTDWHHKSTGIESPADAVKAEIQVGVIGTGEAWFDNLMFEGGTGRSGSILIANQSFDFDADKTGLADEWLKPSDTTTGISIDYSQRTHGVASEKIIGDPSNYKYVKQTLGLAGPKGTKFNLSGWGKHINVPLTGGFWGLQLEFSNTDGTTDWLGIQFDRNLTDWQQISRVIEAPKEFNQIAVIPTFNHMPATANVWFDDAKVNVVDVPSSTISKYNYADNSSYEYDYDSTNWPDGWYRSSGSGTLVSLWVDLTASNGNVYTGTRLLINQN